MKRRPAIGLLPFYLKLYDDTWPQLRQEFEPFLAQIVEGFEGRGVGVARAPICRLKEEFKTALDSFEQSDVDLIVTLHLAYSPSLMSADLLAATARPILMLDTTMDAEFGPNVDPARIMFDHGIHGVQDLACMLRRRGKPFAIAAGHVTKSDVLERAAGIARAAHAARLLKMARVLQIGESFAGMGDFAVAETILRAVLGISVTQMGTDELVSAVEQVQPEEIEQEMATDRRRFVVDAPEDVHRRSVRLGLGLRRILDTGDYLAFSMNFLAFNSDEGPVDTVPFLEASKAMGRGLGYAGEGDVLTAALVGALNQAFGQTTFTEIFCPDWRGNSLFLSHMGEINPEVAAERPRLCEKDFPWTAARNPAVITCAPKPGPAVLANLAPGPGDTFDLIVAPVEVLGDAVNPELRDSVRGWIRPAKPLASFLEEYSRHGGTHHSALVLGDYTEAIAAFASFAEIEAVVL